MRTEGVAEVCGALAKALSGLCMLCFGICRFVLRFVSSAHVDRIIRSFYRVAGDKDVVAPGGLSKADFAGWIGFNCLNNVLIVRLPVALMVPFVRATCHVSVEDAGKIHSVGGAVVAIPHFAEFIPAVIAVALCAPRDRPVAIFYEAPDLVANNAVFDRAAERLLPQLKRDVVICHNNASGLMAALRVVRSGGTLIIMPDVVKDSSLGTAMPFLSRSFVAMTGIGSIARKTGVPLIPIIPRMAFDASMTIGDPIVPATLQKSLNGMKHFTDYVDYCIMRKMFERMSAVVGDRQAFWKYWSSYSAPFHVAPDSSHSDRKIHDLLNDPWLSAHTRPVIDFSTSVRG